MKPWPDTLMIEGQMIGQGTRRQLRLAGLLASLAVLSSILLLAVSGWFLTAAALAGAAGFASASAFNYLIPSAAIRLFAIIRTITRYGERIVSHKAALESIAEMRADLFARLAAQDSRFAPDLSAGDASGRLIKDIEALEDMVIRRPARTAAIVAAVASVGLLLLAGWLAALWLVFMLAILPFLLGAVARRLTHHQADHAAERFGQLRTDFVDLVAARPEIAAYGLASRMSESLQQQVGAYDRARQKLFNAEAVQSGFLVLFGAVTVAGVLLLATAPAPLLALGMLSATAGVEAMAGISRTALRRATVKAGMARLVQLLALDEAIRPPVQRHASAAVLTIGTVQLLPGERLALTGVSGSGKSRILQALAGLTVERADLAVGGQPLADCAPELLKGQFALSAQDAPMLAGTIADNLRLARPGVTHDDMWRALAVAQLQQRIMDAPDGLDTQLGEAGGMLSGGERKRLSLARALLAERPWLLLDEPTEGLDAATEGWLVTALDQWLSQTGTGLVLVSHRPAPLALAGKRLAIGDLFSV